VSERTEAVAMRKRHSITIVTWKTALAVISGCVIDTLETLARLSAPHASTLTYYLSNGTRAVIRNLFRGGSFSPTPFLPSLSTSFPAPRNDPSRPPKGFGGARLAPPAGEKDICSHQTSAEPQPQTHFGVFRAQETCLAAVVKWNLKTKANLAVSDRTVCYCVVA